VRGLLVVASFLIVIAATISAANADGASPQLTVASAVNIDDIHAIPLIGDGGQVFVHQGDDTSLRWIRRQPGGFSASITAARTTKAAPLQMLMAGKAAPLFRWIDDAWQALPVGQKGKTVLGDGPVTCVAVGRQIFVWKDDRMQRVGQAAGNVTGVWASSETSVYIATEQGAFALRGKLFKPIGGTKLVGGIVIGATKPVLAVGQFLVALDTGRRVDVGSAVMLATAAGKIGSAKAPEPTWIASVVSDSSPATYGIKVVKLLGTTSDVTSVAAPDNAIATSLAIDSQGRILLTADSRAWLYLDGSWRPLEIASELAAAKPGSGPAFTQ
jgi:hypothetical protein